MRLELAVVKNIVNVRNGLGRPRSISDGIGFRSKLLSRPDLTYHSRAGARAQTISTSTSLITSPNLFGFPSASRRLQSHSARAYTTSQLSLDSVTEDGMTNQSIEPTRQGEAVLDQFPQLQELMAANEKWATDIKAKEPELLNTLSKGQVSASIQSQIYESCQDSFLLKRS